jgi:dihydrofolate reductase
VLAFDEVDEELIFGYVRHELEHLLQHREFPPAIWLSQRTCSDRPGRRRRRRTGMPTDEIGGAARSHLATTEAKRKDRTMKLTTTTHVSLDGVMQGLGGADEDRSGGFERGGWAIPLFDNEAEAFLLEVFGRADAFLFGRKTYDIFAGYWGVMDPSENDIAEALNTKPRYVASSTLTEPEWDGTTVLSDDVAAAVAELKAKPGGELQVHGSGALIRWLLENDLVDEINLFTYPVVIGQGTRLFPDTGPDRAFELIESQTTPGGVIIQVYRPAGRPEYGTSRRR